MGNGRFQYKANGRVNGRYFVVSERITQPFGVNFGLKQHFVHNPVADARHGALVEQNGFNGAFTFAKVLGERFHVNFQPVGGYFFAFQEIINVFDQAHALKFAGTNKTQIKPASKMENDAGVARAVERRMVIGQVARHAKVHSDDYIFFVG